MPIMKAVVIHEPGGPEVLKVESIPIPTPLAGEVVIRVKAFGLNGSEMFTRQGHSPGVRFPRVLGIEAVGLVEEVPGDEFRKGDIVATAMGGMGRAFDGGYAEYACVPAAQVQAIQTRLPWAILGAIPEMLQTAWGSLFKSLGLAEGERLLIRCGTTSVGLAAAAIAKNHRAFVAATTRNPGHTALLRSTGVDDVIVDAGSISDEVRRKFPGGRRQSARDDRNRDARGLVAVCEAGRHCVHDRDCRKQVVIRSVLAHGGHSHGSLPDGLRRRLGGLYADAAQ